MDSERGAERRFADVQRDAERKVADTERNAQKMVAEAERNAREQAAEAERNAREQAAEAERARRLLLTSLRLRGVLFHGERGKMYRDAAGWLASGSAESLLTAPRA